MPDPPEREPDDQDRAAKLHSSSEKPCGRGCAFWPGSSPAPTFGGGSLRWAETQSVIRYIPDRVNDDEAYWNAEMHSDRQNALVEHDSALKRQITSMLRDNTELYKKYTEDQAFQDNLNEILRST